MPRLFKRTLKILTMPPRTLKNKINNFFWFRRGLNHDERANVLAESAVRQKNDLEKYFDGSEVTIFWGSSSDFLTELNTRIKPAA